MVIGFRLKTTVSRALLSCGFGIASIPWWFYAIQVLRGVEVEKGMPTWGDAVLAGCSAVSLAGLLAGSRWQGKPLTIGTVLELLVDVPTVFFVLTYVLGFGLVVGLDLS